VDEYTRGSIFGVDNLIRVCMVSLWIDIKIRDLSYNKNSMIYRNLLTIKISTFSFQHLTLKIELVMINE
jgi:hypothetical protein